ncbi:MAG: tRNA (adenosine(37)-N6)-dimethylallyltransferase MiaA [Betaproteobacteria bacterium]|nr:tRNA (adenosine(37)-N6)-dimethylallyltransferase MiaA [Betaproteobacteria bacterium]
MPSPDSQSFPPRDLPRAVFILGPTASGKSAAAMHLARHLPVEIISVDSAQVYRGMDVGTAKPSTAERAAVPHHLIDLIDPTAAYSAAQFRADASRLIADIHARGRLPLLVGGTLLYVKALEDGLSNLPEADANIRKGLEGEAARRGWPAMHAELARLDPVTAARLKPNDSQRIQRALEVFRITGKPMSALQGARSGRAAPFDALKLALIPSDRAQLHVRIAARFDQMLARGLVDELRDLQSRFALQAHLPAMRCVGYRQAWEFLAGEIDAKALRERGVAATRQLAKRQHTWLRSMSDADTLDGLAPTLNDAVRARVERWLANIR